MRRKISRVRSLSCARETWVAPIGTSWATTVFRFDLGYKYLSVPLPDRKAGRGDWWRCDTSQIGAERARGEAFFAKCFQLSRWALFPCQTGSTSAENALEAGAEPPEGPINGVPHAPEQTTAGRATRRHARTRHCEICRGLMLRALWRHPRAGDGNARGSPAALAQGAGARLGHRRIRHAAARNARTNPARSFGRTPERQDLGNPAADRPFAARGGRAGSDGRAPDHRRL